MANLIDRLLSNLPFGKKPTDPVSVAETTVPKPDDQPTQLASVDELEEVTGTIGIDADAIAGKQQGLPSSVSVNYSNRNIGYYNDMHNRGFLGGIVDLPEEHLINFAEATNERHKAVVLLDRIRTEIDLTRKLADQQRHLELELVPEIKAQEVEIKQLEQIVPKLEEIAIEAKGAHLEITKLADVAKYDLARGNKTQMWLFVILAFACIGVDIYMLASFFQDVISTNLYESCALSLSIVAAAGITKVIYDTIFDGPGLVEKEFERVNKGFLWVMGGILIVMLLAFGGSRMFNVVDKQANKEFKAIQKQAVVPESSENNDDFESGDNVVSASDPVVPTAANNPQVQTGPNMKYAWYSRWAGGIMMALVLLVTTIASAVLTSKAFAILKRKQNGKNLQKDAEAADITLKNAKSDLQTKVDKLLDLQKQIARNRDKADAFRKRDYISLLPRLYKEEAELISQYISAENKLDVGLLSYFQELGKKFELTDGPLSLQADLLQSEILSGVSLRTIKFDQSTSQDSDSDNEGTRNRSSGGSSRSGTGSRSGSNLSNGGGSNFNYGRRPHQQIRRLISGL